MNTEKDVLFENLQWRVTGSGLEAVNQNYKIQINELGDIQPGTDRRPEWPGHMAEKYWCDSRLFFAAFRAALEIHNCTEFSPEELKRAENKIITSSGSDKLFRNPKKLPRIKIPAFKLPGILKRRFFKSVKQSTCTKRLYN